MFGKDERFADLEVLDGERTSVEELDAGFEGHFDEGGGGKDDMGVDLVVFEKGHVPLVEAGEPDRDGAGQAAVEQAFAAGGEATFAQFGGFVPPAAFVPRVGGQAELGAGTGEGGEVEADAGAVEVEGGFEEGGVFAFASGGRGDRGFEVPGGQAFLNGEREGRVRADFEPDLDAVVGEGVDGGHEADRLADAAAPVICGAVGTAAPLAGDGAEERHRFRARGEAGERGGQGVGRRLHQGVVERVVDADEAGEDAFGFQFGDDALEGGAGPGERE